ncbi:MAG: GDP-mannose 4,6-dehydratase, partial [Halobaculum sp.]
EHGIDVRVARIFNTYGPRMRTDDGRAIPNFLTQALRGDDLTVYGDGSQTRSFCYVSDLIAGIRAMAEADPEQVSGEAINVGNTHEITILELAETILDLVDTDSGITYRELPEDDPKVRQPDISKARELVDWEPTVDLETGLERTVEAFRDELGF